MSIEAALLTKLLQPTKQIVNAFSDGGGVALTNAAQPVNSGGKQYLHSPVSADTLVSILDITGSGGIVSMLSLEKRDTTAYSARIKVTVDGTVVFDASTTPASTSRLHLCVVGHEYGSGSSPNRKPNGDFIVFQNSLKVEVSADTTGANLVAVYATYQLK